MKIPLRPPGPVMRDLLVALLCVAFAALLVGCGGDTRGAGVAPDRDRAPTRGHAFIEEPLLADNGNVLVGPAEQPEPAYSGAPRHGGRYATHEPGQAQLLVDSPSTALLDLDEIGSTRSALMAAERLRERHGGRGDVSLFVRSKDAHAAARLADALAAAGFTRVFVMV